MKLKIGPRLLLLQVLPREGDITTLRIVQELRSNLSFKEDELAANFLRQEGDLFVWGDPEKKGEDVNEVDQPTDIPIGERAFDIIKLALQRISTDSKLVAEFIPLYEHFVEGKEWDAC